MTEQRNVIKQVSLRWKEMGDLLSISSWDPAWRVRVSDAFEWRRCSGLTSAQPQPWSLLGPHQAGCWGGQRGEEVGWGTTSVGMSRDVHTDMGKLQALCPVNISAHSETTLLNTDLSQVPNLICQHCVEKDPDAESRSMTKGPTTMNGTNQRLGVGRAAVPVLCICHFSRWSMCTMTIILYVHYFFTCS